MDELAQFDVVKAAIEKAEPHERVDIDAKLSVIAKIAKKIRADLEMQNKIAIARIDNLRKLGDQLDEARKQGLIQRGAPYTKSIKSLLGKDLISDQVITYADELNDWPKEEYEKYLKKHGYERTHDRTTVAIDPDS